MKKQELKEMIWTLVDLRDWRLDLLEDSCEDDYAFEDLKKEVDALNYCIALLTNMEEKE